jgi:IclR family acetate operon transcriptional repressor
MQTIDRIVSIMQRVAESPSGLTLSQVARATDLAPATCHRLLQALGDAGFVEREEATKLWRPGIGLVRIAASVSPSPGFGALVDPRLAELRDRWQECFFLSVLIDQQIVCVRSIETSDPHRVKVGVPLGRRMAFHASASAKAILAHLDEDATRALLAGAAFERFTRRSHRTVEAVMADLEATRDRGFAVCDEEMEIGVVAYAATVAAPPGEAPRSLGVIGPRERMRARQREGILDALMSTAEELSEAMGAPAVAW